MVNELQQIISEVFLSNLNSGRGTEILRGKHDGFLRTDPSRKKKNVLSVIILVTSTCCWAGNGFLLSHTFKTIVQIPYAFIYFYYLEQDPDTFFLY